VGNNLPETNLVLLCHWLAILHGEVYLQILVERSMTLLNTLLLKFALHDFVNLLLVRTGRLTLARTARTVSDGQWMGAEHLLKLAGGVDGVVHALLGIGDEL
jgi:hypothetical protein